MASVTIDKRNGNVVVRAYAGIDPDTGSKRYLRGVLPSSACDAEVVELERALDERAAIMKETGIELTLDGLVEWYLSCLRAARRPPGTAKTYKSYYFRHISPRRGGLPADDVRPFMLMRDLDAAVEGADRAPISPRTANGIRALLHAAYAAGLADGMVLRNPVDGVMKMDEDDADYVRVFDERELDVLASWIRETGGSWTERVARAAADLALDTGIRVGEAMALRPWDVDGQGFKLRVAGTVTEAGGLHRKATKGKRKRCPSITPWTLSKLDAWGTVLRERFGGTPDWLFPDADGRIMRPSDVSAAFSAACADLGLGENRRFHELRHTHATFLLEQGNSPKTVAERIGDASEGFVLRTYGHVLPGRDAEAAARFSDMRRSIGGDGGW